jgi:hypothetical protein
MNTGERQVESGERQSNPLTSGVTVGAALGEGRGDPQT